MFSKTIFGIFDQLLSTQNVNVARFARNLEYDFFGFSNTVNFAHALDQQVGNPALSNSGFSNEAVKSLIGPKCHL